MPAHTPAHTPAQAIQCFNRSLDAVLADPEIAERLLAIGPINEGAGLPEQIGGFLDAERARWSRLNKELGLSAE